MFSSGTPALEARWEPDQDALGVNLPWEYVTMREGELVVVSGLYNTDMEAEEIGAGRWAAY